MNFTDLFQMLPQVMPLLPRLTKGVTTVEKIAADPDAKDALAAFEQLAAIFRAHEALKQQQAQK